MVRSFVKEFPRRVNEYETLLTENIIWRKRTKNVGPLSGEDALSYGVTGPVLRASGVNYDVRRAYPYTSYEDFDFEIPLGTAGDVFDRYDVRLREMRQSNRIIEQAMTRLPTGPSTPMRPSTWRLPRKRCSTTWRPSYATSSLMEESFRPPRGEAYGAIEVAQGRARLLPRERRLEQAFQVPHTAAVVPQPRVPSRR